MQMLFAVLFKQNEACLKHISFYTVTIAVVVIDIAIVISVIAIVLSLWCFICPVSLPILMSFSLVSVIPVRLVSFHI